MNDSLDAKKLKDLDSAFRNIHRDQLKDAMPLVTDIYVDLSLLVDYRLGALLLMYQNQTEVWNYIIDIIKTTYNSQVSSNILSKFDRLPITDEDLKIAFSSPKFTDILSTLSPMTSLHDIIFNLIQEISISNNRFRSAKEATFNLYLNNPYFELNDVAKASLLYMLKNCTVDVHFISDPDYTHDSLLISEYIFIDNISLFNSSPIVIKMFENGFVDKSIYATPTSENTGGDLNNEETKNFFETVKEIMNTKTDFNFIYKHILYK